MFGMALNPETPIEALREYLPLIDVVILMLVRPGFARGKMVDDIMEKVANARKYFVAKGYENILISVDGSVTCERARVMASMGADIFVGGTAGIYRNGYDIENTIADFRAAIMC